MFYEFGLTDDEALIDKKLQKPRLQTNVCRVDRVAIT